MYDEELAMDAHDIVHLNPCARCGRRKVLKPGDYCIACALDPDDTAADYIIVSTPTLEEAVVRSGISGEYLKAKHERCFERFQNYIIFFVNDEWHEIVISDRFAIPPVMKNLFKLLREGR
jgi:hypothetical protein